jgi:hypothetical protein
MVVMVVMVEIVHSNKGNCILAVNVAFKWLMLGSEILNKKTS